MGDPDELALVVKAIKSGLGGCVEWHHQVVDRIRDNILPHGLTLDGVKNDLIAFVRSGGAVRQVKEQRHEWRDRRAFYYKAILPVPTFKKGLFIEIELSDADEDFPEVQLVNAHEQT